MWAFVHEISLVKFVTIFLMFRFDLSSSQSHDMQMSTAAYGHDLMTDNDMEVHWMMMMMMTKIDNDDDDENQD